MATVLSRKPIEVSNANPTDPWRNIDWVLLIAVGLLCAIGLVAIYTATYTDRTLRGLDPQYYVKREGMAMAVGLAGLVLIMRIGHQKLRPLVPFAYIGTMGLLMLLLVVARATNGSEAWFDIGPLQLQPSEVAKAVLLLTLATYLGDDRADDVPYRKVVGSLILAGLLTGLVVLQPDLGTASVLVVILMGVLLVAGAKTRHIAVLSIAGLISVGAVIGTGTLDTYQQKRLVAFLDQQGKSTNKDVVLQIKNSKAAISNGGVWGKGYLKGPLTNGSYVPEQHTDFIYTAIAEQFGMVGGGVVLALYGVVVWRIWRAARVARDQMGALICAGAAAMFVWHVFQNVGMTMGIMPITGIPLPFLSYGGSSVVSFLAVIGLVESVHMRQYA